MLKKMLKKPLSKSTELAVRASFMLILIGIIITGVSIAFKEDTGIQPTTEYEEKRGMPVSDAPKSTVKYYEKEWSPKESFDGCIGTDTELKTSVIDDNDGEKDVNFNIGVYGTDGDRRILMKNDDSFRMVYTSDIRLIDSNLYVLFTADDTENGDTKKGYIHTERGDMVSLDGFTTVYDAIGFMKRNDGYEVTYNCQTEKDGKAYDDITVYFSDYGFGLQLLVDADTKKAGYIITPMLYTDDFTKIIYEGEADGAGDFSADDVDGAEPFAEGHEPAVLPNRTTGVSVDADEMKAVLTMVSDMSSYGLFAYVPYDEDTTPDEDDVSEGAVSDGE